MKGEIVTTEEYRGYEIQVREEWKLAWRKLTGYGINHTGDGINFQTPSRDVSILAPVSEYYEAVPQLIENAQDAIDVVYEGDEDEVLDEMSAGRIIHVWSANLAKDDGEKTEIVEE